MPSALQFFQLNAVGREPLAIWMFLCQFLLDFTIVVDATFLRVDEQNLSWLQTSLAHHIAWLKVHHTHFACHHHHATLRNGVAAGAQAVPVQHTASIAAVAEEQCRRTIPRLHQDGMIFVERLQVLADGILVVETLWH